MTTETTRAHRESACLFLEDGAELKFRYPCWQRWIDTGEVPPRDPEKPYDGPPRRMVLLASLIAEREAAAYERGVEDAAKSCENAIAAFGVYPHITSGVVGYVRDLIAHPSPVEDVEPFIPTEHAETLRAMMVCAKSWAPEVRLLGNVTAESVGEACAWVLSGRPADVPECQCGEHDERAHPAPASDEPADPQHPAYALGRRDGIALAALAAGLDRKALEAAIDEGTAAAIAPAAGEGERDDSRCCEFIWCYSNDPHPERYEAQCATREAAIAEATTEYDGAPFYLQKFRRPSAAEYAPDADDIIEMMRNRAWDDADDAVEEFPDVGEDATAELEAMLCAWAREHCVVTFWTSDGCGAKERIDPNAAPAATGDGGERHG
jgi:hypothetical protein